MRTSFRGNALEIVRRLALVGLVFAAVVTAFIVAPEPLAGLRVEASCRGVEQRLRLPARPARGRGTIRCPSPSLRTLRWP
jgi:hypothetical protein